MNRTGPDSIKSWLMTLVCIFLSMIIYAVVRLSGVLFVASVARFNVDRQSASMPYILTDFVQAISSPLTGYLTHKYGVRLVMGLGGVLSTIGIGACFFAEDIMTVTILWGAVLGLGFGLSVPLLAVVVTQHFVKKRAIAMGVVYFGGYLGFSTLPGLVEYLINYYGLSGAFLYIAGIMLHLLPLAMLLRNPDIPSDTTGTNYPKERTPSYEIDLHNVPTPVQTEESQYEKYQNIIKDSNASKCELQIHEYGPKGKVNKGFELESNKEVGAVNIIATSKESELNNLSEICYRGVKNYSSGFQSCESNCNKIKIPEQNGKDSQKNESVSEVTKTYLTYNSSSVCNIANKDESVKKSLNPTDSILNIKENNSMHSQSQSSTPLQPFKVFLEPVYIVVLITEAVFEGSFIAFVTILVDFSRDVGVAVECSKYVILTFSLASNVGLLSFGWVTDNGHMTCTSFSGLIFVIRCITTVLITFSNGLTFLLVAVLLQGLCESPLSNLFPLIVADYYKKEVHEVAISCRLFLCAPVYLVTPTLIGYFRDHLGSYLYLFYLISLCSLISGILLFLAPQLAKFRCGRDESILREKNS